MKFQAIVVSTALAVTSISAQRSFDTFFDPIYDGPANPGAWYLSAAGEVGYRALDDSYVFAMAATGITNCGGLSIVSATDVVVAGSNTSGGVIQHWRMDMAAQALTLIGTLSVSEHVAGVAYSDETGKLYVLGATSDTIKRASWDGVGALGSITLASWLDASSHSYIADADEKVLTLRDDGTTHKLELFHYPIGRRAVALTIEDHGGATSFGTRSRAASWTPLHNVYLDPLTVSEDANGVRVTGVDGTVFEVVDVASGNVIGAGLIGSSGEATPALSTTLTIGQQYDVREYGTPTMQDRAITCVRRYGHPESFAAGGQMDGVGFQLGANIGEEFWFEVGIQQDPPPANDLFYTGAMFFGFRIAGVDPVIPYGSNMLLDSPTYVPAKAFVSTTGWGMATGQIEIPNDPGLIGLVYLMQFAMQDGSEYRLSEVYGALIEGAAASASSPELHAIIHSDNALQGGQAFDSALLLQQMMQQASGH